MNIRIFALDDEPDMLKIASDLLQSEGYMVVTETDPVAALKKIRANPPDLLLLDIRLPNMDGREVCRELKGDPRTKHIPIIMVSVKSDEPDIVVGFELGADDYIPKPFRKGEFLARIKAVLRRFHPDPSERRFMLGPLVLDYARYSATVHNKPIALTPKEFELLAYFIVKKGCVVTRGSMSEAVWGVEFTGSTRTIDVHVDQVRRKLGPLSTWVHSLKGVGYRFDPED